MIWIHKCSEYAKLASFSHWSQVLLRNNTSVSQIISPHTKDNIYISNKKDITIIQDNTTN